MFSFIRYTHIHTQQCIYLCSVYYFQHLRPQPPILQRPLTSLILHTHIFIHTQMESGWRKCLASIENGGNDMRVHNNSNLTNNAWDDNTNIISTATSTTPIFAASGTPYYDYTNQILFNNTTFNNPCMRDPHMMCLRLGKRHYCSDTVMGPDRYVAAESSSAANKRPGKQPYPYGMAARCQVDGCNVALSNVKEYYRRHKVCEIHSKAPKVVVLGLQQRFCQQCSRFSILFQIIIIIILIIIFFNKYFDWKEKL